MATRRSFLAASLAAGFQPLGFRLSLAQAPSDPADLSLQQAARLIRSRDLSPVELCQAYLDRIEGLNPRVNAYITVTAELALEQARAREAELGRGRWRGPLHGIPVALKDNIDTAGIRTTAAAAIFAERVPEQDAEIYRRLKEAGAVLAGKLNMHEFAYGGTSAITHFGPVRNPWDLEHIPGGSSGGSAAAVAARLCCAALGTDTLASVRMPAAYCGITGLKPTHGLASIRGIVPVSESLDCVGPLARSAADCALLLQAMAGHDPLDPVSIAAPAVDYAAALYRTGGELRLGIPRDPFWNNLHPEVEAATTAALELLQDMGAGTRAVELPPAPDFLPFLAEAHAWHRDYLAQPELREGYDPVTLERLLAAGEVNMAEYYEARRQLALARKAIAAVFEDVDLLVVPTTPGLPETIAQAQNPSEATGAEDSARNLFPFNLYGTPAMTVPCGFSGAGLPIGLQICGPRLGEAAILTLAHAWQQATDWHEREPVIA